jgi:uncharacterized protein
MRFLLLPLLALPALAQTPYDRTIAQHRDHYKAEFLASPSPLKTDEDVAALRFFAPDSTARVVASVTLTPDARPIEMPTSGRQTSPEVAYAVLSFTLHGQACQLTIFRSLALANNPAYRDYLFLPFRDATSGQETYGGGRYLDLRLGDIRDGHITLDFNKAYNPYCAYRSGYACPIPPAINTLPVPVRAGEMVYGKAH